MRTAIFVASVLCMPVSSAEATSAIVVRTPTAIVLGADSKVNDLHHTKTHTVCKIGVAKNVVWSEAGILAESTTNFSVDRIAADSIAMTGDLNTRVADFERAVVPKLTEVLNAIKRVNSREWFLRHFENDAALQIVFVAFENGVPNLYARNFLAKLDQVGGTVSVQIKPFESPSADFKVAIWVALGRHEVVETEISKNPSIWATLGLSGAVRHLIELEIAAVPDDVGPPIAIIEITKEGPHWISKGQCALL